jgi:hypothetical protein
MEAIYFVESNGVKYYKTDTFWTKSKDYTHAKSHNDSEYDITRFFESLLHYPNNPNRSSEFDFVGFYDNSLYGYQTIDDSNVIMTHYVKIIKYEDGKFIGIDYKQINRDNKINDILNNE